MSGKLQSLTAFERELLAALSPEPVGLSLAELANGLLGNTGPQARGQVRAALNAVAELLGGLYVGRRDDDLGHADVPLYGVPAAYWPRPQEILPCSHVQRCSARVYRCGPGEVALDEAPSQADDKGGRCDRAAGRHVVGRPLNCPNTAILPRAPASP